MHLLRATTRRRGGVVLQTLARAVVPRRGPALVQAARVLAATRSRCRNKASDLKVADFLRKRTRNVWKRQALRSAAAEAITGMSIGISVILPPI